MHLLHSYTDDFSVVHGVDLLRIPSQDVYAYALSVLDVLFTKKELEESLLFASVKSTKPPLEKSRVDQLFGRFE
jgi:hypothetical protein